MRRIGLALEVRRLPAVLAGDAGDASQPAAAGVGGEVYAQPKYFAESLIQYTNTRLRHKMLFGSDYPLIAPNRGLADFEKLPIKDEVRPLVLEENAARLLGLGR